MTFRIQFTNELLTEAGVSIQPSWFERVFLRRDEEDFVAIAIPSVRGGLEWFADRLPTVRITRRALIDALERERALVEWRRRQNAAWRQQQQRRAQ